MKKLIAVLTLFLAFGFSANAQEGKKMNADEAAKADVVRLAELVPLQGTQEQDFIRLFVMKHNILNDASASQEKKKEITRIVDGKIRATLNAEQIQRLEANPDAFAKLTGAATVTPKK